MNIWYDTVQSIANARLRRKFMSVNAYVRKTEDQLSE